MPPFTAGAHIDVHLANGLLRSYSLTNPSSERHRYVIAVNKDAGSRGGSKFMHEAVRAGDIITIGVPRNNFPLVESAEHSVLVAGGIGITPIWCMIQRLQAIGRSWELYYSARNRQSTAFLDELRNLDHGLHLNLHFNFDAESNGKMLDLPAIARTATSTTHLYCCGPIPMLAAFEKATTGVPSERIHVEYFAAKHSAGGEGGFAVELARSQRSIFIPVGKTILDTLLGENIDVAYSCMEGICGSCETRVLEGVPDHCDLVLTKEEKAANKTMMICCSGSKSKKLVLDL